MGGPHHGLPVLERGQPSAGASAAMLLLHGRGASAHQVRAAGDLFEQAGGEVDVHLYPGMAHIVSADEIAHVRRLMAALTRRDQVERPARS